MVTIRYKLRFNKDYFEKQAWESQKLVCGIDEVGRGCLAGPVVVASVILHPHKKSRLLKDSKLLTRTERLKGYRWILKNSWYSTAIIHNRAIDTLNIYYATLQAMRRATLQLLSICPIQPGSILVDAMPLRLERTAFEHIDVYHFPFGETKSTSIAAASIVAKITRDALMKRFEPIVPGYHLAQHKGYSTPLHKKSIATIGRSIIHRINFLDDELLQNTEDEYEEQQTLC